MSLAQWSLLLLIVSFIFTGIGIWWTGRAALKRTKIEGLHKGLVARNGWEGIRGVVFLGIGLGANSVASLLSIVPAL